MSTLHEEIKRLVHLVADEVDCDNQAALASIVQELRQMADEEHLSFECACGEAVSLRAL